MPLTYGPPISVLFMGTPSCAVPFLTFLAEREHVVGVYTAPDEPQGRHLHLHAPPVKIAALEKGLPVFQPTSLNDPAVIASLQQVAPDLIIVVAYGYKLPSAIIALPQYGCVNIHFSLLPKYRGAAPVARAIARGETVTGATSFFITDTMDAGDIIHQSSLPIDDNDTTETLLDTLVLKGIGVLAATLFAIKSDGVERVVQNPEEATSAPKLKKTDGNIQWNLSNYVIRNRMRAFHPWPGSYTHIMHEAQPTVIKLFHATYGDTVENSTEKPGTILAVCKDNGVHVQCGEGTLWIRDVQFPGGKMMPAYEAYIGRKFSVHQCFEYL